MMASTLVSMACGPLIDLSASQQETSGAAGSTVDDNGAGVTFDQNDVTGLPTTSDATSTSAATSPDLGDAETSDGGVPSCPGDPVHPDPDAPACAPDREGTWMPMSTVDAPSPRWGFTMIWSGQEAIVWGAGTDIEDAGGAYDPTEDVWRPLATTGAPSFRIWHTAVWTGTEMIVWGGTQRASGSYEAFADGARYRPEVDEWVSVTSVGAPSPRYFHSAVWIGDEMFLFGGIANSSAINDGGRYDPQSDAWQPITPPNFALGSHIALWTGSEVIVWGGTSVQGEPLPGGRYDPETDTWQPMTMVAAPSFVDQATGVWTGSAALFHGGCCVIDGQRRNRAAAYDPVADAWGPDVALCEDWPSFSLAVWTGCDLLVWLAKSIDSENAAPPDVLRFDGDTTWRSSPAGWPDRRTDGQTVWTGDAMIVWGGMVGADLAETGAIYRP